MLLQFLPKRVISLRVTLLAVCFAAAGAAQGPRISAVLNDFSRAPLLSPGVQAAILGESLTSGGVCQAQQLPLSTTLCGTRVLVEGMPSPILSVSPSEVVVQFSFELSMGSAEVMVEADGEVSDPFRVVLETHAPGIRTAEGTEFGFFLAPQRSQNGILSRENPAQPGETLTLFAVGLGPTEPPVPAGEAAPLDNLARTVGAPAIFIEPADSATTRVAQAAGVLIFFSGLAPGIPGSIRLRTGCEAAGISPATFCGRPAKPNDALQIFATGLGKATPGGDPGGDPLPTGMLAPADGNPLYQTVETPFVTVADIPAEVLFSGLTPGFAGLYQINILVPAGVPAGDDVSLKVFAFGVEPEDQITIPPADEVTIAIAP